MFKTFKHSGDVGDIIYSLPAIRAMGGGTLYLAKVETTRQMMSDTIIDMLAPLLLAQSYIDRVLPYRGEAVYCDLDKFRPWWNAHPVYGTSIASYHLQAFGLSDDERDKSWIEVAQKPAAKVVFHRSPRYWNQHFPWKKIVDRYRKESVFVGLPEEHNYFTSKFGPVPYRRTHDFLELASVIAGAKLYVGNQSMPYAIAESMKKNSILEAFMEDPNCCFNRSNAQCVFTPNVFLPEL